MGKKYHNEEWLREEYVKNRRTLEEIAEECGVTGTTISDWLGRHGIDTRSQREAQRLDGKHTDRKWLAEQYRDEGRSMADIGRECDVTAATILKYLRRFGIKTRDSTQHIRDQKIGITNEKGEFGDLPGGYRKVMNSWLVEGGREYRSVYVHQLLAIAEGADPYKVFSNGKWQVHHKNRIKWDNRPENIEFTTREKHRSEHVMNRERTETGEWV